MSGSSIFNVHLFGILMTFNALKFDDFPISFSTDFRFKAWKCWKLTFSELLVPESVPRLCYHSPFNIQHEPEVPDTAADLTTSPQNGFSDDGIGIIEIFVAQ